MKETTTGAVQPYINVLHNTHRPMIYMSIWARQDLYLNCSLFILFMPYRSNRKSYMYRNICYCPRQNYAGPIESNMYVALL